MLEGLRAGPERHRTLTATIGWSYDLLSDSERAIMRRLSTFAGPFGLESAYAVATDERIDRATAAENLANLVAKSLGSAEVRDLEVEYRLLDTTRAFALEKLAENNELEDARRRHAEQCFGLLGLAKADAERLSRTDWLARYGARVDDVRDALRWAFASAATSALGVRLTVAAIPFGKQVSLIEECRIAVERALDERFRAYRSARDELLLNLTLGTTLLHIRGRVDRVKSSLAKALRIAEELEETELRLECLRGLFEYELWTGDPHSAMAVAERIRTLEAGGQAATGGNADPEAGTALSLSGAFAASRLQLENIVQRPASHHPHTDAARFEFDQQLIADGALAMLLWLQGFPDQALAAARRQLEKAEASSYAVSLCHTLLHGSAIIALYVRDYEAADRYLTLGAEHATRHGLAIWRTIAIGPRCRLNLYTGQPVDLAAFREALAEVRDGGFRRRYPNYLTNYGEALARQGDVAGGLAAIDEAMALSTDSGQIVGIPEMLRIKGNVLRFGEPAAPEKAAECYLRSIELARRDGALSWELRSALSLVKLCRRRGGSAEAEDGLASAHGRFREGFGTGDLKRARALMDSRPMV